MKKISIFIIIILFISSAKSIAQTTWGTVVNIPYCTGCVINDIDTIKVKYGDIVSFSGGNYFGSLIPISVKQDGIEIIKFKMTSSYGNIFTTTIIANTTIEVYYSKSPNAYYRRTFILDSSDTKTISIKGNACISLGDTVVLTCMPADSYLWQDGQTTQAIAVIPAAPQNMFHVSGKIGTSTFSSSYIYIFVKPRHWVNASADTSINIGDSVKLYANGADTYIWSSLGVLKDSIGASIMVSPNITTAYMVIGNDSMGCQASDTVTITVIISTGISVNSIQDNKIIYPNPANDYLFFNDENDLLKAEIFNEYGLKIIEINIDKSKKINIQNMPAGICFIKLTDMNKNVVFKKFIKI